MNTPDMKDLSTAQILKLLSAADSVHVCRQVAEARFTLPPVDDDTAFLSTVGT